MRVKPRHISQALVLAALGALAVATLFPFFMTAIISQKSNAEIYRSFWSMPSEFRPEYFTDAFRFISPYMVNSIIVSSITVLGVLALGSISGYVFARLDFEGKRTLFTLIIALMMVPGILTLVPAYKWYNQLPFLGGNNWLGFGGTGLLNTWWVLVIPWVAGGQILAVFLCRTFFEQIDRSMFEAARIDGASELGAYFYIALPLSLPILATVAILSFVASYNDYIWPLVTLTDNDIQLFAVGVTLFGIEGNLDQGPVMAGFIIGSVPLILIFAFGMRYYVEGLTRGGLKA
jgi:ABC-type glycerol-3-phosphate transport system permease component